MSCVADPELTARAAQTRAAIVRSAMRLFRQHGYEATTMRAIARDAGVSTGNAYYYFGSKEELIQSSTRPTRPSTSPPAGRCWTARRTSPPGCAARCAK